MPKDAPRRPNPVWGPILSALLLALAFAGAWPLVFVALVPWLLSLRGASPRQAWNRGYAFGFLFSLTQLWWLGDLAYKWTQSPALGVAPWLVASLLSAVYYGLLGRLVRSCADIPWAIPLVWAGMEVFRSYIPVLAFPWALLGEPLVGTPAMGLAWYGAIYLVSAFAVGLNVALAAGRKGLAAGAALVGGAWALVAVWQARFPQVIGVSKPPVRIATGQPGVDMAFDEDANAKIGGAVSALIDEAARENVDLLVLPEGIARGGATIPPATPFRVPNRPALVFGGQRGGGPVYQSAFGVGEGRWSFADKTRLVIFGEFVPGRDYLPFLQGAFHLPGGDLSAGEKLQAVKAGQWRVGPLICFEALFPDLAYRQSQLSPDVIAVMSIDDWFQGTPAPARLASAARWRAVETGEVVARAGTLGKTMIVSPSGEVKAEAPIGARRLVVASFFPGPGRFGGIWLFPVLSLLSLVGVPLAKRWRGHPGLASFKEDSPSGPGQN